MDKNNNTNFKDTKYCKLISSLKLEKDELGYQYAIEKIYVKQLEREEIRICLYKDMRDRGGSIRNRMLVRPVDVTEKELLQLLQAGIQNSLFTDNFISELKKLGGK